MRFILLNIPINFAQGWRFSPAFFPHISTTGVKIATRRGIRWISNFGSNPKRVFLTHGEEEPARSLGLYIESNLKLPVTIPNYRETIDLV